MGVFYNSICIPTVAADGTPEPDAARQQVRGSLRRWLGGRGFELSAEETILFDLDGAAERCAFVVWNEHWTILVFSKYEEERRLIRELQTWASTLLYVWVQDSDVWGYDLFAAAGFAGSFNSDPRSYRSFADEELGTPARPLAERDAVCRLLGRPDQGPELLQIQRRRSLFKEDACLELCRWLGAEAAAVSYDDLERGTVASLPGWQTQQLLFFHRDWVSPPACGTDLHQVRLDELAGTVFGHRPQAQITPELLVEVEQMRRRAHLRFLLLRPVSWLARGWRWSRERLAPARPTVASPAPGNPGAGSGDGPEVPESGTLHELANERHRCRITLAPGATPKPVSGKPAAVCAFQVAETPVTCTARRRWMIAEVLRPPGLSEVIRDDRYHTRSGLKVRHILVKLPPLYMAGTSDPSYLALHVVETRPALYVFLYRFTLDIAPPVEETIRETVMSFQLQD